MISPSNMVLDTRKLLWMLLMWLCLLPTWLQATQTNEDSLLAVLNSLPQDTQRVLTYNELFKTTFGSEPLKALHYGQEALSLARKLNYASGIQRMCNNLGVWHSKRGNYAESLNYYDQARAVVAQFNDSIGAADCEMNIGSVYYKMGDYARASAQYINALQRYRQLRDTTRMLSAVNNLGSVYKEQGRFPEALKAYMAALNLRERIDDPAELGLSCANVGNIYQLEGMLEPAKKFFARALQLAHQGNDQFGQVAALTSLAEVHLEQEQPDEAQPLLQEAYGLARKIDDPYGQGYALLSMAQMHLQLCRPDSAQACYEQALQLFREIGRTQGIAIALNHIGELYLGQGRFADAELALLESLQLSDSLAAADQSRDNHKLLSRLYEQKGEYQQAFEHQQAFQAMQDSLYSTEKSKQIAGIQARYEAAQQQDLINRLNLQAAQDQLRIANSYTRNTILLAILLVAGLIGIIAVLRNLIKQRHNDRIAEKNAEIAQQRDLLEAQNRQIREVNVSLERIVEQRTLALRNAKQELDTFLYESAHALRRPLLRIQGLEGLIENEQDLILRTRLRGQLQVTLAGMDELLYKLIYVSETGHRDLKLEPVLLHPLVQEIAVEQPFGESFVSAVPPEYALVTDAYLLNVLMTVILENAFRFLDLGKNDQMVKVSVEQDESHVQIHVQDTGSGIDAQHLPKVCEMFFRGPNHRGGNGLGLYIATKIVEKLHGQLHIQSELGIGTVVTVELPRHQM